MCHEDERLVVNVIVKSEDVAAAVGVSRATVSQILNGRGQRFSESTREKVLNTAQEMGYRPSIAARTLATGNSDIVVALIPESNISSQLQQVLESISTHLLAEGITLLLRLTTENTAPLVQMVQQLRPRAILALLPLTSDEYSVLSENRVPIVGHQSEDNKFDLIIGRTQAEYLVSRGFTQLAYIHPGDARLAKIAKAREHGLRAVCAESGLSRPLVFELPLNARSATDLVATLRSHVGIACFSDDIAIAILEAAKAQGRQVPGDIGIIGMDDSPLAAVVQPRLTTLSIDVELATTGLVAPLWKTLGLVNSNGAEPSGLRAPQVVVGGTT